MEMTTEPAAGIKPVAVWTAVYACACGKSTSIGYPSNIGPPALRCPCGQENTWKKIRCVDPEQRSPEQQAPYGFVKGFQYRYDPAKIVGNSGAKYGRSAYTQAQHYGRFYTQALKQERERQRSPSRANDDGWQWIGGMPGEMYESIVEHEGDKNVVLQDPVPFLKANDLYAGKD